MMQVSNPRGGVHTPSRVPRPWGARSCREAAPPTNCNMLHIQGRDLEHTWLLYGGYYYPDQHFHDDHPHHYAFDLAWPLTLFALFLLSAVLLLAQIARRCAPRKRNRESSRLFGFSLRS
jgi:hypothetical protein